MASRLDEGADDLVETHEINVTPFIDVILVLLISLYIAIDGERMSNGLINALPRTWRDAIGRLMKVDKLMTEVDHGARSAYEERVAQEEAAQREAA